jgi:sugar lactone lactonase YvrE
VFFLLSFVLLAHREGLRLTCIELLQSKRSLAAKRQLEKSSAFFPLVADSQGNIYFSIQAKNQVFRLAVDGQVTIFAGDGTREMQTDRVLAADSPLRDPRSLAVDSAGDVYIVCGNGLVRVDGKTQVLSTVFETPLAQPGLPASIGEINEMVVGPDGNLYFSDGKDRRIKSYSFATGASNMSSRKPESLLDAPQ